MPKSEKYEAPAIVGKAEEKRNPYLFKNNKSPGQTLTCFIGDCPDKRKGEWFRNTVQMHSLTDGQVVNLTDKECEHLRSRGIEKPITQNNPQTGYSELTGQTYVDARFELHRC